MEISRLLAIERKRQINRSFTLRSAMAFAISIANEERRNRYVVTKDGQRFLLIVRDSEIADASAR